MITIGGSSGSSSPQRVSNWNKEQKALFSKLQPRIMDALANDVPIYPRQMYVPQTEQESAYFGGASNLASSLAATRANLGRPAYEINANTTEQYYENALRDPAMREWERTVNPTIKEAFAGPGYWGSARATAEAEGAKDLATELGRQRAELYYADEQARRQVLSDAANREAQYGAQYAETEGNILGAAGQYSRMIAQEQVQADMQRWLMGEEVDGVQATQFNPMFQLVFQALGLTPFSVGSTTSSSGWGAGTSWSGGGGGGNRS